MKGSLVRTNEIIYQMQSCDWPTESSIIISDAKFKPVGIYLLASGPDFVLLLASAWHLHFLLFACLFVFWRRFHNEVLTGKTIIIFASNLKFFHIETTFQIQML